MFGLSTGAASSPLTNETRALLRNSQVPGTGNIKRRADPRCSGAQLDNGRRWRVRSKSRGCGGLWEDDWAAAKCAGALGTSLAEGTVVLWPGHLEMNYKHSEDDGSWLVAECLKDCMSP